MRFATNARHPVFREALNDENSAVRLQAVAALGSIKDAKAVL